MARQETSRHDGFMSSGQEAFVERLCGGHIGLLGEGVAPLMMT